MTGSKKIERRNRALSDSYDLALVTLAPRTPLFFYDLLLSFGFPSTTWRCSGMDGEIGGSSANSYFIVTASFHGQMEVTGGWGPFPFHYLH